VHGLHALRETLQQDKELTIQNTSIGIVGPPAPGERTKGGTSAKFRILEGDVIDIFLKKLPVKEVGSGATAPASEAEDVEMQA
jgi:20S proteasome subunit alpha 6